MSDLDHRVGVSEANLVVRHLKLTGITDGNLLAIVAEIDGTFGIDAVSFEEAKNTSSPHVSPPTQPILPGMR